MAGIDEPALLHADAAPAILKLSTFNKKGDMRHLFY